ncbi:GGDEF domain-containing protein [Methylopila jiangsuensis]|uniref:diguanylate cyclase n=1 Tax=Methylopila jiangsuensis TaxID=586230 RepID=A0A9W6N3F8_9HYPH|nr:sensor domain-containing diguanylate cyclase [Methylopila jiangsuensis]MDR6284272.1 diguanylate cyclase (GGDEF)-like protein [Methylopila jiangsuensis]GLK76211.1 GGDEF domain-containing protein [Methylopila jiangsuensis]
MASRLRPDDARPALMSCRLSPEREDARLATLRSYDLLDTPQEESFDRLTRLGQRLFDTPVVLISLIDRDRQWFKSRQGFEAQETPREPAFCNITIQRDEPLVVLDATRDLRFADNPFVVSAPHIRFYAGAPLRTAEGVALGALCVIDTKPRAFARKDVAALNDLAGVVMDAFDLRRQATTDALTGVLSRRAFRVEAERGLDHAALRGGPFSLVTFDLDRFKSVNDTHGHMTGDLVLRRASAACQAELRAGDPLGRLGGEEFAVALPVGEAEALEVARRLQHAIAAETFESANGPFQVTASFGVASWPEAGAGLDDLMASADAALYAAKAQGRDRCVSAAPASRASPFAARGREERA